MPLTPNPLTLNPSLLHDLQRAGLEVRTDPVSRRLYSTDASIYQIEPLGVAFPRRLDDLNAAVELAARYEVPILARGGGSSLAGQAVGAALILDCSRYLDQIHEIHAGGDGEGSWAVVEPGVVMSDLNRKAAAFGLQFGPDPASADRATMGGSLANNASGAHSIVYGMFADHLLSLEAILGDGIQAAFEEIPVQAALRRSGLSTGSGQVVGSEGAFYASALEIRQNLSEAIKKTWPRTWRRAAGYNLNYLLPWSASAPPQWASPDPYPPVAPGSINLAHLIAGSEGTLAVVRLAAVRLVPKPQHTVLAVLPYGSIIEACEAAPGLLARQPSAVELIPQVLIRLARGVPAYQRQLSWVRGDPAALLVVEFSGENKDRLIQQARALSPEVLAESAAEQKSIWAVRKVGLGILQSQPGDLRAQTFIEDLAVPVEHLGEFVRGMDGISADFGTQVYFYAHASAGCLHIRPLVDLKTRSGVQNLRGIAEAAVDLTLSLGGTTTGEHGDGLARSEWLERMYGPELVRAFRELKTAADPKGILNPGKIVDPLPMDANLRYGADYQTRVWQPVLSFERQDGLDGAVEMCNGAGVCRKFDGVMCPSFQATREEMHSTRGRANLLRALIRLPSPGQPTEDRRPGTGVTSEEVMAALDLCLACKGCKAECPSAVDMAKLKYEFSQYYYQSHRRKLRDYLFGYIGRVARLGAPFGKLANWGMGSRVLGGVFAKLLELAPERSLPKFAPTSLLSKQVPNHPEQNSGLPITPSPTCLLLLDPFTEYFYPEDGQAALSVLRAIGFRVKVIPVSGAGRTLISKGFLKAAKAHAQKVIEAISALDPDGKLPIVGVEPSEIYTLSDEYPDFFPQDEGVAAIARRAWMIDEFLLRQESFLESVFPSAPRSSVLLHGHCYQKARPPAEDGEPVGVEATVAALKAAGYAVDVIDSGCCGMAGAFGYEAEHYELSMQIGELALFPAVRKAGEEVIVAAAGVSCQSQIEDGTQRKAVHPIRLIAGLLETQNRPG